MKKMVRRMGGSLGIPLTKHFKKIGVNEGDEVDIDVREDEGEIVIRKAPQRIPVPEGFDPRFFEVLSRNVEKYREALEGMRNC